MAEITLGGNKVHTKGSLPAVGSKAPNFKLTATDLSEKTLNDFAGHRLILNIFPSLDTGICAASIRHFNQAAASLPNTKVLCISRDTPFAHGRFCTTEGIENVVSLSQFRDSEFGNTYGVTMTDGSMQSFLSRAVVIVDENGTVIYTEQVPEIAQEPDYDKALAALK